MRKPRKVMIGMSAVVDAIADRLLRDAGIPRDVELAVYCTDTERGRASRKNKNITVPLWATRQNERCNGDVRGYMIYYTAHELAHIIATTGGHGPEFMAAFRKICPPEYQHYELRYKPRAAKAAGISK